MIELERVSKRFVKRDVVSDLSFVAELGEVLGFLGPNGAGKSTTMKMITGFLLPSAGTIKIAGLDIHQHPIKSKMRMGYLPEGAPLYQDMEVGQFLSFIADIRQLRGQYRQQRIAETLEQMELTDVLYQPIGTLSKGFIRRVGMAQALIHDPEILILDEPTDGLDPNQKHHVRQLIQQLAHRKLIVVSTHILEEVSAVCSRAIIIHQGKKIVDDTPNALEAQSRYFRAVSMHFDVHVDMAGVQSILRNQPTLSELEQDDQYHIRVLSPGGDSILPRISELIRHHGWPVKDLYVERGRLEDVFRALTVDAKASADNLSPASEKTSEVA
jgi:ABC-2 type transport system ATP-binding protein